MNFATTWQRVIPALLIVAAFLVSPFIGVMPAQAAVSNGYGYALTAGPLLQRHGIHTEFMGSFNLDGRFGYCIDYGLPTPPGGGFHTASTRDPRISYIASKWGHTTNRNQAGAVNASINLLIGNAEFRSDWNSSYLRQLAHTDVPRLTNIMLSEAGNYAGPYRVTVRTVIGAPVGESSAFNVAVQSTRTGRGLAGAALSYAGSVNLRGTSLPRSTNAVGQAVVRATALAPGAATLRVTASNLQPWNTVLMSVLSAGRQRLIQGAPRQSALGTATFTTNFRTVAPTFNIACNFQCKGQPPVSISGVNPRGGAPAQLALINTTTGTTLSTLALPGDGVRHTAPAVLGQDGQHYKIQIRRQISGVWTRWTDTGVTFEVVCPPGAEISVVLNVDCAGNVVASVTDHNFTRYLHRMTVVLSPTVRPQLDIASGHNGTLSNLSLLSSSGTVLMDSYLGGVKKGTTETVGTFGFRKGASSLATTVRHASDCGSK